MNLKNQIKLFIVLLIFVVLIIVVVGYKSYQYLTVVEEYNLSTENLSDSLFGNKTETVIQLDKPGTTFQTKVVLGKWNNDSLNALIQESKKYKNINDRIDYISQRFLGIPYKDKTLIGDKNLPEKLVINLEGVDCFTFLDYVLSLAIVDDINDFFKKLKFIRYESGKVNFKTRNHFFSQWIDNNVDYLLEVSDKFGNSVCLIKELNKKKDGEYWVEGITPFKKKVCYIPKDSVLSKSFNSNFRNGDIIGFYTNLEGLDVTHLGIISIQDSEIYLRHATPKYQKVVDEKLEAYLKRNVEFDGLIIVRIKD